MASAIDATKPVQDSAALTSDLRANLAAAKSEIEALQDGKITLPASPSVDDFLVYAAATWAAVSGAAARTAIGLGTGDSPQFTGIELGHATDTTLSRASAGDVNIEGNIVYRAGGTDVPVTDGGTGASDAPTARNNLGVAIGTDVLAQQTIGIADNNLLEVDDPAAASGQYSRFTANGLEGRTEAEFKADFNLEIGTDVQAYDADTTKNDVANAFTANQTITFVDDGAGAGPILTLYRDSASPATSDMLGAISFSGNNSVGASKSYSNIVPIILDPTDGSEDSALIIQTKVAGVNATPISIGPGIQIGGPTGGDKGFGTINAVAVYDDNVLLTCYPFEQYLDGNIDLAKWDNKVPNRIIPAAKNIKGEKISPERIEERKHVFARKFKARIGTVYDPLDIDKYANHWKEKRHLTALPNEQKYDPLQGLSTGEWIQRLIETVEVQAVHIDNLNQRLKTTLR